MTDQLQLPDIRSEPVAITNQDERTVLRERLRQHLSERDFRAMKGLSIMRFGRTKAAAPNLTT